MMPEALYSASGIAPTCTVVPPAIGGELWSRRRSSGGGDDDVSYYHGTRQQLKDEGKSHGHMPLQCDGSISVFIYRISVLI